MNTRTTPPTPNGPRLYSIRSSGRTFGAMTSVAPFFAAHPEADSDRAPAAPRSSALARRLDQAAQFSPRSHKGPPQPRSHEVREGDYQGTELEPYAGRPGAMDANNLPSRMGDRLHYRDGRTEDV